jgi:hypothetical protein
VKPVNTGAAASTIATLGVAVLMTACGSGSRPTTSGTSGAAGSTRSPSVVAYSVCVRSHGVRKFPDPGSAGQIPKGDAQQLGVSPSQLEAAEHTCAHLISPIGETTEQQQETQCATAGDCSQIVVQKWMSGLRTLARCLRAHGEPGWPDPVIKSAGRNHGMPHFDYEHAGIDHHSPQVLAKVDECARLTGFTGLPLP